MAQSFGYRIGSGVRSAYEIAKGMGKDVIGTTYAVGADVANVLRPWEEDEDKIKKVQFAGRDFITPSARGARAGEHFKAGNNKEGAGDLMWAGLDVISFLPAGAALRAARSGYRSVKVAKAIKTGKPTTFAKDTPKKYQTTKDVLKASGVAGGFGAAYGAAEGMSEGETNEEIYQRAGQGAVIGSLAGLTFGIAAGVVGKGLGKATESLRSSRDISKTTDKAAIVAELKKRGIDDDEMADMFTKVDDEGFTYQMFLTKNSIDAVEELTGEKIQKDVAKLINNGVEESIKRTDSMAGHVADSARIVDNAVQGIVSTNPTAKKYYHNKGLEILDASSKQDAPKRPVFEEAQTVVKPVQRPKQKITKPKTPESIKRTQANLETIKKADKKIKELKNNVTRADTQVGRADTRIKYLRSQKPKGYVKGLKKTIKERTKAKTARTKAKKNIKKLEAQRKRAMRAKETPATTKSTESTQATADRTTGVKKTSKPVKTNEATALKTSLKNQARYTKEGKFLGFKGKESTYTKLKKYAKELGLSEEKTGDIFTQASTIKIKTKKDFDAAVDKIARDARKENIRKTKTTLSTDVKARTKAIDNRMKDARGGKGKKPLHLPSEANGMLNRMKSDISNASSYRAKVVALKKYEKAVELMIKALAKVRENNATYGMQKAFLVKRGMTEKQAKKIADELARRVGFNMGKVAVREAIINGRYFTKQADDYKKAIQQFREGDELMNLNDSMAVAEMFQNPSFYTAPLRVIKKNIDGWDALMDSHAFSSLRTAFASVSRIKERSPVLHEVLSAVMDKETIKNQNLYQVYHIMKRLRKDWNKSTKRKDKDASIKRIFDNMNGEDIKLTPEETALKVYLKGYFAEARTWMQKNINNFDGKNTYVYHRHDKEQLWALIRKHGLVKGTKKFGDENDRSSNDMAMAMFETIGNSKAGFVKERMGADGFSTDIFKMIESYAPQFERMKQMTESNKYLAAFSNLTNEAGSQRKTVHNYINDYYKAFNKRKTTADEVIDKIVGFQYVKDLSISGYSMLKNFIGGAVMDINMRGVSRFVYGNAYVAANPRKSWKVFYSNGLDSGGFVDTAFHGKGGYNWTGKTLMLNQRAADVAVRMPLAMDLMQEFASKSEKATGKLKPRTVTYILDEIDKVLGVYSQAHTPAIYKSKAKVTLMYTRWMHLSVGMIKNSSTDVVKGIAQRDVKKVVKNANILIRTSIFAYAGLSMVQSVNEDFAAYGGVNKLKKTIGQTMLDTATAITMWLPSMTDSPSYGDVVKIINSLKIAVTNITPWYDPVYDEGNLETIGDIRWAPLSVVGKNTIHDFLEEESYLSQYKSYKNSSEKERRDTMQKAVKSGDKKMVFMIRKYENYTKNNISKQEFDISFISDEVERAEEIHKYVKKMSSKERADTLNRFRRTKIIDAKVLRAYQEI